MKNTFLLAVFVVLLFMTSCNNNKAQYSIVWENKIDSLQSINAQQQMLLDDMTVAMADISKSLDTIAMHERMVILRIDEEGNPISKKELKSKLSMLSEIIRCQREKMEAMERDISDGKSSIIQLKSVIAYLNASLVQKETEIQQLKIEVDTRNYSIARLNTHLSNLKDTVKSVRQENETRRLQMEYQNERHDLLINEVFYVIGTKEQLTNIGVLSKSGIIFKKTKINFESIDKSVLTKADKRTLKNLKIQSKSPKILSDIPDGSYTLDKGTSESTLTIIDSDKFWSANNRILVIQTK